MSTSEQKKKRMEEIAADYEAGTTIKDLAEKYRLTLKIVNRILNEMGVIRRRRGGGVRLANRPKKIFNPV